VAILKRGDSFDEYSFLSDNISKTEYRCVGVAVLYKITRDEFIKVVKES
jgi:CRP-like cAMP-binding protein